MAAHAALGNQVGGRQPVIIRWRRDNETRQFDFLTIYGRVSGSRRTLAPLRDLPALCDQGVDIDASRDQRCRLPLQARLVDGFSLLGLLPQAGDGYQTDELTRLQFAVGVIEDLGVLVHELVPVEGGYLTDSWRVPRDGHEGNANARPRQGIQKRLGHAINALVGMRKSCPAGQLLPKKRITACSCRSCRPS
mgnify:CR=1 FL=1